MAFNWEQTTVDTYNNSAEQFAEYFAGIGARTDDIDRAIELTGFDSNLRVVEIGCGDGRDAQEITQKVSWYEGVDPSAGMLAIARQKVADGCFILADAETYVYPRDITIIFAFASLLHVSRRNLGAVLRNFHGALVPGGIAYLSLKHRVEYESEPQTDTCGSRMFYYYSQSDVMNAAGNGFSQVYLDYQTIGTKKWMTIALKKR